MRTSYRTIRPTPSVPKHSSSTHLLTYKPKFLSFRILLCHVSPKEQQQKNPTQNHLLTIVPFLRKDLFNSTIRQVPDHQEVYLKKTGFTSLIFDLGERVSHTATDEEALRYHFDDVVDEKDTKKILDIRGIGSGRGAEVVVVPSLP